MSPPSPERAASIVITNWNYGRFLREAIDSALGQTCHDVEVIVVDDGSTDDSRRIIQSYGDAVLPLLKDNGGQSSAMNLGFEKSSGRLVVFLDADDTLAPRALELASELFSHGVSRVGWSLWVIDESGRRTGRVVPDWGEPAVGDLRKLTLDDGPEAYAAPPQSGNAFSRAALDRAFPLPTVKRALRSGAEHADAFLVDLAGLIGSAAKLDEPEGSYRVHSSNGFANLGFEAQLPRLERLYYERCKRLAQHCEALGLPVDTAAWQSKSSLLRTVRAKRVLEATVPEGADVALLDDNGIESGFVSNRRVLPFPERDGESWGSPADGDEAIHELERLRTSAGGGLFAVAWTAFWWFEHYRGFADHLRRTARCIVRTDELEVYALDAPRTSDAA
jgi:hypothetical protein